MTKLSPDNFHRDELLQGIFDAIPAFVFIVDGDVRLLFWNSMAQRLVGDDAGRIRLKRGGDAIHCVHSFETPEGCGTAAVCITCPIRTSVASALREKKACRAFTRVQLCSADTVNDVYLLVTASPFLYQQKEYALLLLEDVSHVIALDEAREQKAHGSAGEDNNAVLLAKEREILTWLKKGKSSWDISQILRTSERTVNYHIYNIIQKLDAMNRTHAVAIALEKGLIHSDPT